MKIREKLIISFKRMSFKLTDIENSDTFFDRQRPFITEKEERHDND